MDLIEPDVIFRRLAQIIRIIPIVYNGVMVVIASRIIGSPSDNGDVVMGNCERWPFDDLDMLSPRRRRRIFLAARPIASLRWREYGFELRRSTNL